MAGFTYLSSNLHAAGRELSDAVISPTESAERALHISNYAYDALSVASLSVSGNIVH
jgi:hypothetical protein